MNRSAAWTTYTVHSQTLAGILRERDEILSEARRIEATRPKVAVKLKAQANYINQLADPFRKVVAEAFTEATKPTLWERFKAWVK